MFTTVIRTIILYFLIIFAMRMMGKRQIGDMQPSELVVTLLISEIAAIPIQDASRPILSAVCAIFILIALEIIITVITLKSSFINNLANGQSVIVIKDGKILQNRLKKLRITVSDLIEMLREQGIFDIGEVAYAILETSGNLSVMQKSFYRNLRFGDAFPDKNETELMPYLLISDGNIIKRGLNDLNISEKEFLEILKAKKIKLEEVFILTMDSDFEINYVKKES